MMEEELSGWNSTFKSKIQQSDLKRPTEAFLVQTLVAYLTKFGYKMEPPFSLASSELENSPQKQLFMIRLAQVIDRVLKYCDKTYTFTYIDLIKPVPKKTSKILSILLNYYFYYEMFKEECFDLANKSYKKRGDLIRAIEEIRRSNEECKQDAIQIKNEIIKLAADLPLTQVEKEDCLAKTKQQEENLKKIKNEVEHIQRKVLDLQIHKRNLENKIVHNKEALTLKSELKELQTNIDEHNVQEHNIQISLSERTQVINHLEKLLICVKETKVLLPEELLIEYKNVIETLKQSRNQYENINHEVEILMNAITKCTNDIQFGMEKFICMKKNYEQEKRDRLDLISEKQRFCVQKKNELNSLKSEWQENESLLNEQIEIHDFIKDNFSKFAYKKNAAKIRF